MTVVADGQPLDLEHGLAGSLGCILALGRCLECSQRDVAHAGQYRNGTRSLQFGAMVNVW